MTYNKPEQSVIDEFATRLQSLVKAHDPDDSFDTLGKHFGISSPGFQKWFKGQSMPKMENACLIALRYQVCVEWLLTGRGDMKIKSSESELDKVMALLPMEAQAKVVENARAYLALQQQER